MPIGALILFALAILILLGLFIPRVRTKFHSFLDRITSLRVTPIFTFSLPFSLRHDTAPSKVVHARHPVQELIHLLNEGHPCTKEEIREIFIQVFAEKVVPTIKQDDATNTPSWLIEFYPPERNSVHARIVQTKEGVWVQKEKTFSLTS